MEQKLYNLKMQILKDLSIKDDLKKDLAEQIFQIENDLAINYTRCSTPLKRESKSFFNVKNLADLKRLYPNKDSYNAKVCDGYIKYYVNDQLVITTALMV